MFREALACHQAGDWKEAERLYRRLLARDARHTDALHLLGLIASEQGEHAEALRLIGRAVELRPNTAVYLANLGLALRRAGNLEDAIGRYRQALALDTGNAATHFKLGSALRDFERIEEAEQAYSRAITLDPAHVEAHYERANALHQLRRYADAIEEYKAVIALDPLHAEAYFNLAVTLMLDNRIEESEIAYRRALQLHPGHAQAFNNLGHILQAKGLFEDALECYRQSLRIQPDYVEAHYNLGVALQNRDRVEEAAEAYRHVLALDPRHADAHNNLGSLHLAFNELPAAIACYERAVEFAPEHHDAPWNLGLAHLSLGHWEEGWQGYEWRFRMNPKLKRDFQQPHWRGEPLEGKTVLLVAEQGLGDTLQFVRYRKELERRGARTLVEVQERLRPLLGDFDGQPFDYYAHIMSLPGLLGGAIPAEVPYLNVTPAELGPGFKVGLCWSGNVSYKNNHLRSMQEHAMAPLQQIAGVRFFDLQHKEGDTLLETARTVAGLDLVITVDTMIAHLAGGLGRPVWTLLCFAADWRWMLGREDSPWYPAMRLFRQSRRGDWAGVIERVRDELCKLTQ
jgi:tetratricopeptide (TPR) repeat protein